MSAVAVERAADLRGTQEVQRAARKALASNTAEHVLTVSTAFGSTLARFAQPGSSMFAFEVHFATQTIAITGDIGSMVLALHEPGTVDWAAELDRRLVSAHYWMEKIDAAPRGDATQFSPKCFVSSVDAALDAAEDKSALDTAQLRGEAARLAADAGTTTDEALEWCSDNGIELDSEDIEAISSLPSDRVAILFEAIRFAATEVLESRPSARELVDRSARYVRRVDISSEYVVRAVERSERRPAIETSRWDVTVLEVCDRVETTMPLNEFLAAFAAV